jgi:hypothetical protein
MASDPLLVFDPNPKCFGATSAMLHIIKHLEGNEILVLAGGSAAQLTVRSDLTTLSCDVKDPNAVAATLDGLEKPFLYVSISNLTNIPTLIARRQPLVHVDILFWLSGKVNSAMTHANAYIIENFPGVADRIRSFGPVIRAPHLVGPLVNKHTREPSERNGRPPIVVNLGGSESPFLQPGSNTDYPAQMVIAILEWADRSSLPHDQQILIGTGERAVRSIRDSIELPNNVALDTYPLKHFNALIADCSFLITAPGLNAPFEAFRHHKPVVFLPPQNFTQVFQLRSFQEHGIQQRSMIDLESLLDLPPIALGLGELAGTAVVLERLQRLVDSHEARERMASDLERQIALVHDPERRERLLMAQDRFMERLGDDGPKHAARIIKEIACA